MGLSEAFFKDEFKRMCSLWLAEQAKTKKLEGWLKYLHTDRWYEHNADTDKEISDYIKAMEAKE